MNTCDPAARLKPGLYRVHWRSGGSSLAAIGICPDGARWLAPTNWVRPAIDADAVLRRDVERLDPIAAGDARAAIEVAARVADRVQEAALGRVRAGHLPYLSGIEADTARDIAVAIRALGAEECRHG